MLKKLMITTALSGLMIGAAFAEGTPLPRQVTAGRAAGTPRPRRATDSGSVRTA